RRDGADAGHDVGGLDLLVDVGDLGGLGLNLGPLLGGQVATLVLGLADDVLCRRQCGGTLLLEVHGEPLSHPLSSASSDRCVAQMSTDGLAFSSSSDADDLAPTGSSSLAPDLASGSP